MVNVMKCDSCYFKVIYTTGIDEYPPLTGLSYCVKGHWENGDPSSDENNTYWDDCIDFKEEN